MCGAKRAYSTSDGPWPMMRCMVISKRNIIEALAGIWGRGLGGEFCMCDVRLGLESCWSDWRGKGVAGRIYVDR